MALSFTPSTLVLAVEVAATTTGTQLALTTDFRLPAWR